MNFLHTLIATTDTIADRKYLKTSVHILPATFYSTVYSDSARDMVNFFDSTKWCAAPNH